MLGIAKPFEFFKDNLILFGESFSHYKEIYSEQGFPIHYFLQAPGIFSHKIYLHIATNMTLPSRMRREDEVGIKFAFVFFYFVCVSFLISKT